MRKIPYEKLWDHLGKREKLDLMSTKFLLHNENMLQTWFLNCSFKMQSHFHLGSQGEVNPRIIIQLDSNMSEN